MITYTDSLDGIAAEHLNGFFENWRRRPTAQTHLRLLRGSDHVVLALDDESGRVVGFVTAIADGVLAAYLPLLEVLPDYRGHGIGRRLLREMRQKLSGYYMVDVVCDEELVPFYEEQGFRRMPAISLRDYEKQDGRADG